MTGNTAYPNNKELFDLKLIKKYNGFYRPKLASFHHKQILCEVIYKYLEQLNNKFYELLFVSHRFIVLITSWISLFQEFYITKFRIFHKGDFDRYTSHMMIK